jgi:hypothetical protein
MPNVLTCLKKQSVGYQGLEQSEDKGYLGVQSRYGAIEPRSGTLGWESSSRLDVFSGVID